MPPKLQKQPEEYMLVNPEESDAPKSLPQRVRQPEPELYWPMPKRQPEMQGEAQWIGQVLLAIFATLLSIVALAEVLRSIPAADNKLPPTLPPAITIDTILHTPPPRDATGIPTPQPTEPDRDEEEPEQPDATETPTESPPAASLSRL